MLAEVVLLICRGMLANSSLKCAAGSDTMLSQKHIHRSQNKYSGNVLQMERMLQKASANTLIANKLQIKKMCCRKPEQIQ